MVSVYIGMSVGLFTQTGVVKWLKQGWSTN